MRPINNSPILRLTAAALALILAWPPPASALKVQAVAENHEIADLAAGLEEPNALPQESRRQFLRQLAVVAGLNRRFTILVRAFGPLLQTSLAAEPVRKAHRPVFDAAARSVIGTWILWGGAEATARELESLQNGAVDEARRLDVARQVDRTLALLQPAYQEGLAAQRQLAAPAGRAAFIAQLQRSWSPEEIERLAGRFVADWEASGQRVDEARRNDLVAMLARHGRRERALGDALAALPERDVAEGLSWAVAEKLRALQQIVARLEAALMATLGPQWSQRLQDWAVEQFRVVPASHFRRLEGSVVGFYVEGEGLRFARPPALAIAQAPAGMATLSGVVSTEADKAALVASLATVSAAQTLAAEGIVTLEQIPNERDAREEAFHRMHVRGATFSHTITAAHDEGPVAYLQRLLFQFGVTLPPDLERPDEFDPEAHAAALTLLRAA